MSCPFSDAHNVQIATHNMKIICFPQLPTAELFSIHSSNKVTVSLQNYSKAWIWDALQIKAPTRMSEVSLYQTPMSYMYRELTTIKASKHGQTYETLRLVTICQLLCYSKAWALQMLSSYFQLSSTLMLYRTIPCFIYYLLFCSTNATVPMVGSMCPN